MHTAQHHVRHVCNKQYLELFKLANSLLRDISTTHHTVTKQFNNDGAFDKVTKLKI